MRPKHQTTIRLLALVAFISQGACAARYAIPPPSRKEFVEEVILGVGTPTTPWFSDTEAGFHADKLDLLQAFRAAHIELGDRLQGFAVYGPNGGLWKYTVLAVLKEGDAHRLNWLVFPHARITGKGTVRLDPGEYQALISAVSQCHAMQSGIPSDAAIAPDSSTHLDLEWRYQVLFADWSSGHELVWFSIPDMWDQQLKPVHDLLDSPLKRSTRTYANYGGQTLKEILNEP